MILLLAALISLWAQAGAQIPGFAKDPAISPDGKQVCFVLDDDLWLVPFSGGTAHRITNTPSAEWSPQWSPDGNWIAFNSNREGQTYPYLISAKGGEAKVIIRESYSINDWFKDGKHLLVLRSGFEWGSSFYKLPIDGSRATLIGEFGAAFASLSPDNRSIVFARYGDAHREAYTGSLNGDLWKLDIASKKYTRLTKTEYTERYPRFSHTKDALYYAYSDGKRYQLFRADKEKFSRAEKLSKLPFFSVRDISIARANDRIVFEHFDEIYRYDPDSKAKDKVSRLDFDVAEDTWQNTKKETSMLGEMDDYNVSDNELLVAYNFMYDSFLVPRKGGLSRQLTFDHSGYSGLHFITDRKLLISKLHKGKESLFIVEIDSLMQLTPLDWFGKDSLVVERINKDSKGRWQIHYGDYSRSGRIAVADSGFVNLRPLNTPWVVTSNFALNKAGTHAVYAILRDDNYMRELYLYDFGQNQHQKILTDDNYISNIMWSEDERSLIFTRNSELYRLDLVPRDEFEYETDNWLEVFEDSTKPKDTKAEPDSLENKSKEDNEEDYLFVIDVSDTANDTPKKHAGSDPVFEIVWEGIDKRMYPIFASSGRGLRALEPLSDSTFMFIDQPHWNDPSGEVILKKGDIYGKGSKELFNLGREARNLKLIGTNLYYQQSGRLKSFNTSGNRKQDIKITTDYSYDTKELNKRVFEQAWGAFGDNFYDPGMHGLNWNQIYERYRPYADKARNINEIGTIIDEMIGDVNASHTGFYPRREEGIPYKATAYLGLDLDYTERPLEGIRIARVYPNTRLASFYKVESGDLITHLDGIKITNSTPLDSLLAGKAGKQIKLSISSGEKQIEAQITALNYRDAYNLWYEYKVNRNRERVETQSGGRLGYIHVPSMGNSDYDKFYRDVFRDNHDKEALVLDFRGNTGGRIHDMIISLLIKDTYAYSSSRRYSLERRPEPLRGIKVPTIVLVDERSFSDGEIFPIVYKELGLGKVVGYPSSGAVIGTWEYSLIDGSSMRMPGSGWYKMDGTNMEGTGAIPDIIVENNLNDLLQNKDAQLERAVKELLKELQ